MKAEGDCPECGNTLGVEVDDTAMPIPESTMKRLMNKDGNGMWCQTCSDYHDPDDITVKS